MQLKRWPGRKRCYNKGWLVHLIRYSNSQKSYATKCEAHKTSQSEFCAN